MSRFRFVFAIAVVLGAASVAWAQRDMVPSPEYYRAFGPYYEGDYPTALQAFKSAARGGVRSTEGLWVDSICYHAMMGECFYRMGDLANALEQSTAAIKLAAFHSEWLLRVTFLDPTDSNSAIRSTITWGGTARKTRLARVPDKMLSFQGRLDNMEVIQRGGVVAAPQLYPLNVKEVVRCTAVALRRRREILGPVGPSDPLSGQILATFTHYATAPNHWSQAWMSCYAGLAFASAGKLEQAAAELNKSLVIGGVYDHELTSLALVELGRLNFEQGQYQAAAACYLEATYAAAEFEQLDVLEDAFRGGQLTHLVSGQKGLYGPLGPASEWARRRSRALQAGLLLLAADNLATQGQTPQALKLLGDARQALGLRGSKSGPMAARFHYLSALVAFTQGNPGAGTPDLATALTVQKNVSPRLFQIGVADRLFLDGAISQRIADGVFSDVLREPTAADWNVDPLDTLAVVSTPHPVPLEHWFGIALERKDTEKAMEIADRIRRHRFLSTLPMGGRLLALRWILEAPEPALSQPARLQRQDLLNRYPGYAKLAAQNAEVRRQLAELPLVPGDTEDAKKQRTLFEQLAGVSLKQELVLQEIALRREPAEFVFPPLLTVKQIQERMPEGQLVLAYLVTSRTVTAFALSREKYGAWTIDKPAEISKLLTDLLKQFGLNEKKIGVTATVLKDRAWSGTAGKLLKQLTGNRIESWEPYQELVVVPDGILWYVPFEALTIGDGDNRAPLLSKLRVRYVPTLALANADFGSRRPNARTAVIVGKMTPSADAADSAEACKAIQARLEGTSRLDSLPVPSSVFTAACDRMIVLSDLETNPRSVYGWSPTAVERGKAGGTLEDWFALPWQSPGELVLPGFHTPAEAGFRRGSGSGTELFLNACALMATGTHSILISRWPTGGQSAFDLIGEYVQELPFETAAEAWKRSVQLAADRPVDPELEPRVDRTGWADGLKADHPFFWAGYVLIDTGSRPNPGEPASPKDPK